MMQVFSDEIGRFVLGEGKWGDLTICFCIQEMIGKIAPWIDGT
jgi:hypothetical protein